MELQDYVEKWKGKEVVAFCGPIKYRGTLVGVLEGGFLVLNSVAIMNPAANETSEYANCVLNVSEISGLAYEEVVGRGTENLQEY